MCPFVEECGGCDLMHLSAEAQRDAHRSIVEDALRRTAGLASLPEIVVRTVHEPSPGAREVHAAPSPGAREVHMRILEEKRPGGARPRARSASSGDTRRAISA